ncbi:substrate-binding and GGDEF domain-containing protein [Salinibius halmophilus]|uniref:substrate-binding and GGDEF domain-containing protein n=1 Tax=Salinibius halmophilus TaxID=1853216 RepID=UPI001314A132|nr:GGDEF domain-containing protein [Salinibius halmophilus]
MRALFVTSNLNNGYQSPIFYGLNQFARTHDLQLFTYALTTATPDKQVQRYLLQQLIHMPKADVLIINSATFEFINDEVDLRQLRRDYGCHKLIVVGRHHDEHCSIAINNASGISQCVAHLVDDHQFVDIGYIGGPTNVRDAQERQAAFIESIEQHQITLQPKWILDGDFTFDAGYKAIQGLSANDLPQAIVCADDYIAFGALKAISDLDYDIHVTGFDNVDQAQYSAPPLTTVHQPLYEMGWQAGEQALTPDNNNNILVDCELVKRSSCGCHPIHSPIVASNAIAQDDGELITKMEGVLQSRLALHKDSVHYLETMLDLYLNLDEAITVEQLINKWQQCVFAGTPNYYALSDCNSILTEYCLTRLTSLVAQNHLLEISSQLDSRIHTLINDQYNRLLNDRSDQFSGVLGLTRDLDTSTDQLQLVHSIERAFEAIGIEQYCLVLTKKKTGLFYDLGNLHHDVQVASTSINISQTEFSLASAVPPFSLWSKEYHTLCILPLMLDRFYFGQLILVKTNQDCDLLEHIRHNITVALLSHSNIEQSRYIRRELESTLSAIESHNRELLEKTHHDELTGLNNRRGFMQLVENRLNNSPQVLYFGDMNNLKTINDQFGHHAGDKAICLIAEAIVQVFPGNALCARIGGDEFVVMTERKIDGLAGLMQAQLNTFKERYTLNYPLSIAFGVAESSEAKDISELLSIADQRLYQAKRARRKDGTTSSANH